MKMTNEKYQNILFPDEDILKEIYISLSKYNLNILKEIIRKEDRKQLNMNKSMKKIM